MTDNRRPRKRPSQQTTVQYQPPAPTERFTDDAFRPRKKAASPWKAGLFFLAGFSLVLCGGGAVSLGIIFWPKSPRSAKQAEALKEIALNKPILEAPGEQPETSFQRANQLFYLYEENQAVADKKCLNRPIEIIEAHGRVRKDEGGSYYIEEFVCDPWNGSPSLVYHFAPGEAAKIAALQRGQRFTLRGVCKGRQDDAGAWRGFTVIMQDCRIAD